VSSFLEVPWVEQVLRWSP